MSLWPFVTGILHRARVPVADVPDLAQQVLIALLPWWSRRTPGEIASVDDACRAYVRVVARNTARHPLGGVALSGRVRTLDENDLCALPEAATSPSAEELWIEQEEAAELAREMELESLSRATTPERWRVFRAYAVDGIPVREIARTEQTAMGTIYRRIALARLDLRAAILRRRAAGEPPS